MCKLCKSIRCLHDSSRLVLTSYICLCVRSGGGQRMVQRCRCSTTRHMKEDDAHMVFSSRHNSKRNCLGLRPWKQTQATKSTARETHHPGATFHCTWQRRNPTNTLHKHTQAQTNKQTNKQTTKPLSTITAFLRLNPCSFSSSVSQQVAMAPEPASATPGWQQTLTTRPLERRTHRQHPHPRRLCPPACRRRPTLPCHQ